MSKVGTRGDWRKNKTWKR